MAVLQDAANVVSRVRRSVARGYQSAMAPYAQPGREIPTPEPFSPGTVTNEAGFAKAIGALVSGSRMAANDRQKQAIMAQEAEKRDLEMQQLRGKVAGEELVDYTDEDGTTYQVPRSSLDTILAARARRTKPTATVPFNDDVTKVGSAAWKRAQDVKRQNTTAGRAKKASNAKIGIADLDAQVKAEAQAHMQQFGEPQLATWRNQVMQGDRAAMQRLGIDGGQWAALEDARKNADPVSAAKIGMTQTTILNNALAQARANGLTSRVRMFQQKYAGKYAGFRRTLAQVGSTPEDDGTDITDESGSPAAPAGPDPLDAAAQALLHHYSQP